MVEILGDECEHPTVRGQAAEVLSYLFRNVEPGSPEFAVAVPVLTAATRSSEPEVRYCAANTIGRSGDPSLRPVLEAMLNDETPVAGWHGTVADEARRSLESLHDIEVADRN